MPLCLGPVCWLYCLRACGQDNVFSVLRPTSVTWGPASCHTCSTWLISQFTTLADTQTNSACVFFSSFLFSWLFPLNFVFVFECCVVQQLYCQCFDTQHLSILFPRNVVITFYKETHIFSSPFYSELIGIVSSPTREARILSLFCRLSCTWLNYLV